MEQSDISVRHEIGLLKVTGLYGNVATWCENIEDGACYPSNRQSKFSYEEAGRFLFFITISLKLA